MGKGLLLASLLFVVFGAVGAQEVGSKGLDTAAIRTQQEKIRHSLASKKSGFEALTERQRSELVEHQASVDRLIANVANTSELRGEDQVQLFNALDAIKAIVTAAEDERMVCERYKPVGTNRQKTMCKTVAQRRAEREAARGETVQRDQSCAKNAYGECLF